MVVVYRTLREHEVEYLTIGGVAVQAYGHPRTTQDVDILVDPSPYNLQRLGQALKSLDARLSGIDAHLLGIDPTNPQHLADGASFTLDTRVGELDVWTDTEALPGARPWAEMRARAVDVHTPSSGIIRLASREDLIKLKQAAAALEHRSPEKRERDLQDIAVLEQARQEEARDRQRDRPPPGSPEQDPPGHDIDR